MRQLSEAFVGANTSKSRSPRFAIKINNETTPFWIVSHADIATGELQFNGATSVGVRSQNVTPEQGISVLGGMDVSCIATPELTGLLRTLTDEANDTIVSNRVDLWVGYDELLFSEYSKVSTFWVDAVDNDRQTYIIKLVDTQRFIKKNIFTRIENVLLTSFTSDDSLTEIELQSTDGLQMVAHDGAWSDAPNQTVGYVKLSGIDRFGQTSSEIIRYTSIVGPKLKGITRSVLGTQRVSAKGSAEGNGTKVEEFIYLELPTPKMLIAIMTGDLYGQAGKTLPVGWHAGLTADKIDLSSFEDVGDDLFGLELAFYNPPKAEAKQFLASQVMRPLNLFLKVSQLGELSLRRFSSVPQTAMPDGVLDASKTVSFSGIKRDSKAIRNRFELLWEYLHASEVYSRRNIYIDQDSVDRNNITSEILTLKLQGIRNIGRDAQTTVERLAEGIRARYSDPTIKAKITTFIGDGLPFEVGDLVRVTLPYPDYNSVGDLNATMEVQGTEIDFVSGTVTLSLFGTAGIPTAINVQSGNNVASINRAGWLPIQGRQNFTLDSASNTLTLGKNLVSTLTGSDTLSGGRYYHDGNIVLSEGSTLFIDKNVTIDCADITMGVGATIEGSGRGYSGGVGQTVFGNWSGVRGTKGFTGNVDFGGEGVRDGYYNWAQRMWRYNSRSDSDLAPKSTYKSASQLSISIDQSGNLKGLPATLMGSSGSGGGVSEGSGADGGSGGASGAGLLIICENLFTDFSSRIKVNGGNGGLATGDQTKRFYGGHGGMGHGGTVVVLVKNRVSPLPILRSNIESRSGYITTPTALLSTSTEIRKMASENKAKRKTYTWYPYFDSSLLNTIAGQDFSLTNSVVKYIVSEKAPVVISQGGIEIADSPVALALVESLNTPQTILGNLSTITMTTTPPADAGYSYSKFQYRLKGAPQWVDITYGIRNEATATMASDGSTYEFSAQSVSKAGIVSPERVVEEITLSVISKDTPIDPNLPVQVQLPKIMRLELVNRIDDDSGFDKFKSPNAVFRWAELSTTNGGSILSPNGVLDLTLRGYKVTVRRGLDVLREELVTAAEYVYTFDKNKHDGAGRSFSIEVQAVSSVGQHSDPVSISVSNPEPAIVTDVASVMNADGNFTITYTPPTDTDFYGVKLRGKLYTGSSITLTGSTTDRDELLTITSVDQFGNGESTTVLLKNDAPLAVTDVAVIMDSDGNFTITYTPPTDADFYGVKLRGKIYTGSSITITGSKTDRDELLTITSVDKIGDGASTTVLLKNDAPVIGGTITSEKTFYSISLSFQIPDDIDYVGADFYIVAGTGDPYTGTPRRVIGNSIYASYASGVQMAQDTTYTYGLIPVDSFGGGTPTAGVAFTTDKLVANDVADLGDWATEINPVDAAFIEANMADNAVSSTQISSLAAGKISTGTLAATTQITVGKETDGVLIDAGDGGSAGGYIQTIGADYKVTMGKVNVPDESANPLILFSNFGSNYPFWVDAAGSAKFSGTVSTSKVIGGLVSSAANPTFGESGYQMGDFSGTNKFYVGDGARKSISFDGTNFNVGADTEIGSTVGITVTVHQTTGDYDSISAALEGLSKLYKGYKYGGVKSRILIKSGYIESVGVDARDVNLGWIEIRGDTGVTSYSIDPVLNVGVGVYAFDGCSAPTWRILPNDTRTTYISGSLFYAYRSRLYVLPFIGNAYTIRRPFLYALDSFVVIGSLDIEVGGRLATCDATVLTINSSNIRTPTLGANTFSGTITMASGSTLNANNVTMYNTAANGSDFSINFGSFASILNCSKVSGSSSNYITAYQSTVGIFGYSSAGTYTTYGLLAQLSTVSAQSCTFRRGGGSDESSNIRCEDGSTIRVKSVGGGTNITKNSTASLYLGMILGI